MNITNVQIEKKIIYNPDSNESLNDRRVFGGTILRPKGKFDK